MYKRTSSRSMENYQFSEGINSCKVNIKEEERNWYSHANAIYEIYEPVPCLNDSGSDDYMKIPL